MLKQITAAASVAAVLILWSVRAVALPSAASLLPGCGRIDATASRALLELIEKAPGLDEARELALAPVEQAQRALSRARWLAPDSSSLRAAESRLFVYAAGVQRARSEAEVAQEVGHLLRLTDSGGVVADVHLMQSCAYSTGEIIAIVIGFILGVLPGIILLIILC